MGRVGKGFILWLFSVPISIVSMLFLLWLILGVGS